MAIKPPTVGNIATGGAVLTGVAAIAGTVFSTVTTVVKIEAETKINRMNAECSIPGKMVIPQVR